MESRLVAHPVWVLNATRFTVCKINSTLRSRRHRDARSERPPFTTQRKRYAERATTRNERRAPTRGRFVRTFRDFGSDASCVVTPTRESSVGSVPDGSRGRGRGLAPRRDRARAEGGRWRETMRRRRDVVVGNVVRVESASVEAERTRVGNGGRRASWMMRVVVKALGLGERVRFRARRNRSTSMRMRIRGVVDTRERTND